MSNPRPLDPKGRGCIFLKMAVIIKGQMPVTILGEYETVEEWVKKAIKCPGMECGQYNHGAGRCGLVN